MQCLLCDPGDAGCVLHHPGELSSTALGVDALLKRLCIYFDAISAARDSTAYGDTACRVVRRS